jgi:hypothetical protein
MEPGANADVWKTGRIRDVEALQHNDMDTESEYCGEESAKKKLGPLDPAGIS